MSLGGGDPQDAHSPDLEVDPARNGLLSHHSSQPRARPGEYPSPPSEPPPAGAVGTDGGSAGSGRLSSAGAGRGRHGASRAHRRREPPPPPPPPPPEFSDGDPPDLAGLRLSDPSAGETEVRGIVCSRTSVLKLD